MKKRFLILILIGLVMTACSSKKVYTYAGGDLYKIFQILENEDTANKMAIGLISDRDICEMSIAGVELTNDANIEISLDRFVKRLEYKGFYFYRIEITVLDKSPEVPMYTRVKKIDYIIDGDAASIEMAEFQLMNKNAFYERYQADLSARELLISSNMTTLFNYIPSKEEKFGRMFNIAFIANNNLLITDFFILGESLELEDFEANHENISNKQMNIELEKNKEIKIQSGFKGVLTNSDEYIYSYPFVVIYEVDNKKAALTQNGGVEIWPDHDEMNRSSIVGPIKKYIENLNKQR